MSNTLGTNGITCTLIAYKVNLAYFHSTINAAIESCHIYHFVTD